MDELKHIQKFCQQTKQAITFAHNGDWERSQSIITERDNKLSAVLSIDFSRLPADTQQQFRTQLEQLEKLNTELRASKGKRPGHIHPSGKTLINVVDENQSQIFEQDEYPPCQCGL